MQIKDNAQQEIIWKTQEGGCNFWWEIELVWEPLQNKAMVSPYIPNLKSKTSFLEGQWDLENLILPNHIIQHIANINIGNRGKKRLCSVGTGAERSLHY